MADGIDIEIVDKINNNVRRKILNIGRAAKIAHGKIQELKTALNFGGLKNSGLGSLNTSLKSLQAQYTATGASAVASFKQQETALNSVIASEQRMLAASEKRASASVLNSRREQDAANTSAAVRETAQQRVRREQTKTFNQRNLQLQKTRTEEQRTLAVEERRQAASRAAITRTEQLRKTYAERFKATQASVASSIQASNNRVVTSTNAVIVKEQALVAALDRSSLGYQKMARAGLAAEAAQNRLAASQTRLAGPIAVTARNTTTLSRNQRRSAIAANELAISNDKAARSAIELKMAELNLRSALDRTTRSKKTATAATKSLNAAHVRSVSTGRRVIANIRNMLAIYGGFRLLSEIGEGLSVFQEVDNKIKSVTETTGAFLVIRRELNKTANEAGTSIKETATAYQRYDKALKVVGASQKEALTFTDTLTKALKNGGATASETNSVLLQMGQALTKGNLDGDELRSLRENAPLEVMQALAKALDTDVGSLKKLGEEGKITTSVIRQAIAEMRPEVLRKFEERIRTISEAFFIFGNKFSEFLRELEERTGIFATMSQMLIAVANNLDTIYRNAIRVGVAFVAFKSIQGIMYVATASVNLLNLSLIKLKTLMNLIKTTTVAGLAIAVGSLIAYSDEIIVSNDKMTTLADTTRAWYDLVREAGTYFSSGDAKLTPDTDSSFLATLGTDYQNMIIAIRVNLIKAAAWITSFVEKIPSYIKLIFARLDNEAITFAHNLKKLFKETANSIVEYFHFPAIFDLTEGRSLEDATKKSTARIKEANDKIETINDASGEVMKKQIKDIVELYRGSFKEIGDESADIARKRIAHQQAVKDALVQGEKDINKARLDGSSEALDESIAKGNALLGKLREARNLINTPIGKANQLVDTYKEGQRRKELASALAAGQEALKNTQIREEEKTRIEQFQSTIRRVAAEAESKFKTEAAEKRKAAIQQIEQQITDNFKQQQELRKQVAASSSSAIIAEFQNLYDQFYSKTQGMTGDWSSIWESIKTITQNAVTFILNLIGQISTGISGMLNKLGSVGSAIRDNAGQLLGGLAGGGAGAAIGASIQGYLGGKGKKLGGSFEDLSKTLRGLMDGLNGTIDEVDKYTKSSKDATNATNQQTQSLKSLSSQYLKLKDSIPLVSDTKKGMDAVVSSFDTQRESANRFFNNASDGYTAMLEMSSRYAQAATQSFNQVGISIASMFSGEKGSFLKGLIGATLSGFIGAKQQKFSETLARAKAPRRQEQDQSGGMAALQNEAQFSQQAVTQLNAALAETSNLASAVGQSSQSLQNLIPANATMQVQSLNSGLSKVSTSATSAKTAIEGIGTASSSAASAVSSLSSSGSALDSLKSSADQAATALSQGISQAAQTAQGAISTFSQSAVSSLNSVRDAANEAAEAQARVGSGGGGGGGLFGALLGFSAGGYTGNMGTGQIAGVVHGQEFVMPAAQTKANRGILEAMRSGRQSNPRPVEFSGGQSKGTKVTINNNAPNVIVTERQMSDGEIVFMIESSKRESVIAARNTVSRELGNPNSQTSKSMASNYGVRRSR